MREEKAIRGQGIDGSHEGFGRKKIRVRDNEGFTKMRKRKRGKVI